MPGFRELAAKIKRLFGGRRDDIEFDAELREHLDLLMERYIRSGMAPEEAAQAARRQFGNTTLLREERREMRTIPGLETLWQDLRYSFRMLLGSPGFTAVAVLSLAIGIGGNTAIFSLVDRVLIRKLPVEEPDRLVIAGISSDSGIRTTFTYPDFAEYRDRNEVFEGLLCHVQRAMTLSQDGLAERVQGLIVSGNYFDVLRVRPALGRGFLPEEDKTRGSHPVVVLGYGLWQRRFAADPALVGKTISLNGYSFTVVGIAPPEFTGTMRGFVPDIYVPIMMQGQVSPGWRLDPLFGPHNRRLSWLEMIGRLKPGVSREQAEAAMSVLGAQIARANPNQDGTPRSEPKFVLADGSQGQTSLLQDLRFPLQMLMATVGLILLITCANVANLLLARADTRHKEIAIRLAAGASRIRLVRQLLTESLLLAGLGGAAGLALASAIGGLLLHFTPNNFSAAALENQIDLRVLGFTLGLSLLTGVLFGLSPALIASRPNLVPALKDQPASFGGRVRRLNLRNLLVVGQVALSVIVLVGASLCVRSLRNLQSIDTGFDTSRVLVMSANVSLSGYSEERGLAFYSELIERIGTLPGVEAASLGAVVPLNGGFGMNFVAKIEGHAPQPGEDLTLDFNIVSPDYFRTMKVPLVQGREFLPSDTASSAKVAIINETAARRFWPGQDPVGRRLSDARSFFDTELKEIVGVVKDSKYRLLSEEIQPTVYVPLTQDYRSNVALHVRTSDEPEAMLSVLRGEVQAMDAGLPLYDIRTLEEQKSGSLYTSRMAATLLTVFGLMALLLAAMGLYGVVSYAVSRRTREIGIRLALGAPGHQIRLHVMAEGMVLVLIGLVLGLGGAVASTHLLENFLFGVTPSDAISFVGVAFLLAIVALLANYLPARRASRTDPMIALRT